MFGSTWNVLSQPVRAIVRIVDPGFLRREIGLSAMQLTNLDLTGQGSYGNVVVAFADKSVSARAYNAFGEKSLRGSGIRITSGVARRLGVHEGQMVELSKENK